LIICFSCILSGCITFKNAKFELPEEPKQVRINFQKVQNGFFLSEEEAINLANNVDELKAYAKKLKVLVEEMERYYK